jgi:SAM-dependent methyltransferase
VSEWSLSIVVPALRGHEPSEAVVGPLRRFADDTGEPYEIVVGRADLFGSALRAGLDAARGTHVITVDGESPRAADVARDLWSHRHDAEVIVASRYAARTRAGMSLPRSIASRVINSVFSRGLSLPVADLSSAFRLYRMDALRGQALDARDYDLLPELLVRTLAGGWRVREIPLTIDLAPRSRAVAPLARLAGSYVRTFGALWQLRNSIQAADYDARAHDSIIPLQRFWQRSRHRYVTELIAGQGRVLDVGCGSSRIIEALPPGSIALDILPNKLRYARRFSNRLVLGSAFHLPFADASFPCVLCSQVIEHVPMDSPVLSELTRVLAPGGSLVLGTPDYDRWEWVYMEKAYGFFKPGGYADEHIAHYTREGLLAHFARLGYLHDATRYILRGELILRFRKPSRRQVIGRRHETAPASE